MNTEVGETTDKKMTVSIKQLDGTTFAIQIEPEGTVNQLKEAIERERNVSPERQRLIFKAQELRNNSSLLTDYAVIDKSILHMVVRPLTSVPENNSNAQVTVNVQQNDMGERYDANGHIYDIEESIPTNAILEDLNILNTVKMCRFIRIFALMDFIFLVLFGLTLSFVFFIVAALALSGYYGAKMLKRSFLMTYMLCLILEIVGRALFIYLGVRDAISVILFVLMIFIDLFILKCVIQLYKDIPRLEPNQRDQIMSFNQVGLF